MSNVPSDLYYTESEEWVRVSDGIAEVGVTDHAQDQLGDIVFLELPEAGRVVERGLDHWADPGRRMAGQINHHDGGRGVYFEDPDGHLLEIITRPYGGGSDEQ